ncbi:Extracellular serine proteinase precursor [Streptomyces venezuelae]|nr:Extracellular serine proteinase precursor [Streptomyces venezuelae]
MSLREIVSAWCPHRREHTYQTRSRERCPDRAGPHRSDGVGVHHRSGADPGAVLHCHQRGARQVHRDPRSDGRRGQDRGEARPEALLRVREGSQRLRGALDRAAVVDRQEDPGGDIGRGGRGGTHPAPAVRTRHRPRSPAATWGLDRINQWNLPLDNDFTTRGNGAGVTAYILDTGIDYAHDEFGGRATFGFDAMGDGRYGQDCNGHGTHVAGTVAGRTYGVARKANLVSVRVLGCDGRGAYSGMIAGLDWVAKNARQPAVLNGSLGGDKSVTLNNAATALANAGVLPVIAAGNDAKDACNVSPASATGTVTVAASNAWDEETSFSNHGRCVELFAPGQDIVSARIGGGSIAQNGTSMAAPHVAGVAALYKAEHPTAAPAEISAWLDGNSTKGLLTSISSDTPNKLLFSGGL